jgi:hypothetical protein
VLLNVQDFVCDDFRDVVGNVISQDERNRLASRQSEARCDAFAKHAFSHDFLERNIRIALAG